MALLDQEAGFFGGQTGWKFDDASGDYVPVVGNTLSDLFRGIGRGAPTGLGRALHNQTLPVGLAMVQTTNGPETNTYTTRVAIGGTLVNTFNFAPGAQVAGTFPAGSLNLIGRTIRIRAWGTTGATGTPNLTVDFGLGVAGASILATTGLFVQATSTTPATWLADVSATVKTVGASATIDSGGMFTYQTTSTIVCIPVSMGNSTRGTPLTLDLTAALAFNIFSTCGTSNAANRIIVNGMTVELGF